MASIDIDPFLADLESRIDPAIEDRLLAQWRQFADLKWTAGAFNPTRERPMPSKLSWPEIRINESLDDQAKMLLHQFKGCSDVLAKGAGNILNVRANFGTPIMAMPFGTEFFLMPEHTNTLPASQPIGPEAAHRFIESGKLSLDHPYLQKVFAMGRYFRQAMAKYPKLQKYVYIYHPDLQGPLDILEMVWGSDVFTAFIDEPETVHRLLKIITDFYIEVMRRWESIVPPPADGYSAHWGLLHRGRLMLRNDSAMNLPPDFFDEFSRPYDQRLMDTFGGGAVHSCGRVDHFADRLAGMPGVYAFNLSQPHLNNMPKVLADTADRGVALVGLMPWDGEGDLVTARPTCGRIHRWM